MSSLTTRQHFPTTHNSQVQIFPFKSIPLSTLFITNKNNSSSTTRFFNLCEFSSYKNLSVVVKAASGDGSISPKDQDYEDGVSLGTMKLPLDVDLARFETLLFQWANSLCQGAMLPLPVPLKVDKIPRGARLCFMTVDDAQTEVIAYIDCMVFPATETSPPIFRAIRNGPLRDKAPPGEPRIMRSLLGALQKSVEIARV
ncbi:putative sorting nexin 3 [Capsicum annuum]|uniref:uncharacterized protein LOC107842277 n=1 Tax=Capsicum annuum TaxID=4072 RepID=UPI001FB09855|nr:uncharacterized protein LOC107842277 [Capsicum annuum]KAF3631482.1 putative sorting nexin 3 [Capsicum annuum]KAF3668317.1 putative sorting nexin 3 [Capsicum annuum]